MTKLRGKRVARPDEVRGFHGRRGLSTGGLIVFTVAVALIGAAPASAAVKNPCKVVTPADASKALGVSTGAGTSLPAGLYQSCRYAKGAKSVTVLERSFSRSNFDKSAKKNPGPVVHLSGIGSDAYSAGGGSTLLLWKNGTELTVLVTGVAGALKAEKTIGKAAAGRL